MMKFLMNLRKCLNLKRSKFNIMIAIILLILTKKYFRLIISILMITKTTMKIKENKKTKIMEKISKFQIIQLKANGLLIKNLSSQCWKINSLQILKKLILTLLFNKNNKRLNKKETIFRFVFPKI